MSSESSDVGCNICLSSLTGKVFGRTDHANDCSTKCCVECLEQWLRRHAISIIGREQVQSYSVYDAQGVKKETKFLVVVPLPQLPDDFGEETAESSESVIVKQPSRCCMCVKRWRKLIILMSGFAVCVLFMIAFAVLRKNNYDTASWVALSLGLVAVACGLLGNFVIECIEAYTKLR